MRVSEYYGMNIYSDKAHYIGSVRDVVLDDEVGKVIGLAFGQKGETVTTVPYDSIMAIGDIVLVKSKKVKPAPEEKKEEEETESE